MRTFRWMAVVVLLTLAAGRSVSAQTPRPRPPNVVFILTDDQGAADLGCLGASDLRTPAIDGLAAAGVRFSQFYASAPICSPSRAGILTGKVPQRAGMTGNGAGQRGGHGLTGPQTTVADVFKAAGYATAHVGKWHLGYVKEEMPNARGFDHSFGFMGGCIDNFSHYFMWGGANRHDLWRNGEEVYEDGRYFGDLMVEECSRYIDAHRDRPFFLYWAINLPHYPVQPMLKWRQYYADKMKYPRNDYAASVSTTDDLVAAVLKKLDDSGLRENTIVVFMSDHGASFEDRAGGGGGSAGVYRGGKFSLFEGGIRVPAIVRWPGHVPAGQVRGQFATGCDWLPTLAELCGVGLPPGTIDAIDGKSLTPILRDAAAASPHATFNWLILNDQWAVRDGDWKLIGNAVDRDADKPLTGDDALFLVNLADDPGERRNVAVDHADVVARLRERHDAWRTAVGVKSR